MATSTDIGAALPWRGHVRALLALGLPLVGSHLAQFAITLTDTVMVGWYDVEALAALVLGGTLYFVVYLVGSGFAWAVMPMVASAVGTDNERQARRVTRMGLWLSVLYGVLLMGPLLATEPILVLMGQEPDIARLAGVYMSIAAWGLIPNLLIMVLKSFLSALERTGVVLWVTIGTAILNALLNYALIFHLLEINHRLPAGPLQRIC